MNVLLISPPITKKEPSITVAYEPLGLAYLDSYLTAKGFEIEILDTLAEGLEKLTKTERGFRNGLTNAEILKRLRNYNPDVIGIACNISVYFDDTRELAILCKKAFPQIQVVLGGSHTVNHDEISMQVCEEFDFTIRGEGEENFYELLMAIQNGTDTENIASLTYRANGRIIRNPRRAPNMHLDQLPLPNRKKLLMNIYFENKRKHALRKGNNCAMLITSRGCPFQCVFCSVARLMNGRDWRPFSVEKVLDDILDLYHNFGVREISILDNNFIVDKERVMKIMDGIISNNLKLYISISAGMSIWLIDKELLQKMKKAGLYLLNIPIESGSPETLKYIRKRVDLDGAKQVIKMAKRLGLWTTSNFIIGFPYESEAHILETERYINSCGIDYPKVIHARSIPGSDLRKDNIKEGIVSASVSPDQFEATYTRCPGTRYFSSQEIDIFQKQINKSFIIHKIISILLFPRCIADLFFRINSPDKFIFFMKIIRWLLRDNIIKKFRISRFAKISENI